jgi:hypothetical protein
MVDGKEFAGKLGYAYRAIIYQQRFAMGVVLKRSFAEFAVPLFLCCYSLGVFLYARHSLMIDDVWMWFNYFQTEPILNGFSPAAGRFFPLASMDLNILMHISSSPYLVFAFNALLFLATAGICYRMLKAAGVPNSLIVAGLCVLFLNPAYVTIITGICYPERLQSFFLVVFLMCSFVICEKKRTTLAGVLLGLLCANLALYLKEPTFILISGFAFFFLFFRWLEMGKTKKLSSLLYQKSTWYCTLLFLSGALFLVLYFFLVLDQIQNVYSTLNVNENLILYIIKGIVKVCLDHSMITIFPCSLCLYRLYLVLVRSAAYEPFYDSLLLCGLLYISFFLLSKLLYTYYFAPAYFVFLYPTIYFLVTHNYYKILFVKLSFVISVLLFVLSSLPVGLNAFSYAKGFPVSFHGSIDFLDTYLPNQTDRVNIYIYGLNRTPDGYLLYSFLLDFLHNRGLSSDTFDLKTAHRNPTYLVSAKDSGSDYTLFNSLEVTTPESGDLIVVSSWSMKNISPSHLAAMEEDQELIFQHTHLGIPNVGIKAVGKWIVSRYLNRDNVFELYGVSENFFGTPWECIFSR